MVIVSKYKLIEKTNNVVLCLIIIVDIMFKTIHFPNANTSHLLPQLNIFH